MVIAINGPSTESEEKRVTIVYRLSYRSFASDFTDGYFSPGCNPLHKSENGSLQSDCRHRVGSAEAGRGGAPETHPRVGALRARADAMINKPDGFAKGVVSSYLGLVPTEDSSEERRHWGSSGRRHRMETERS